MRLFVQLLSLTVLSVTWYCCCGQEEDESIGTEDKWPTIGISILVRNKEHSLPYVLTCLQKQDYPKDRLYIWIYADHNKDQSQAIIDAWIKKYSMQYNKVVVTADKSDKSAKHKDQGQAGEWTEERLKHIIKLREKALNDARKQWADYVFMLDADVFLTDPLTLKSLVRKQVPIVAPMLISDGRYSNFWGGMTEKYYYKRTDAYAEINDRDKVGCFTVPMVHSAVLFSLRTRLSDRLSYDPANVKDYKGPTDDIITFAISATVNGINMTVCNDRLYGFLPVPIDLNLNQTEKTSDKQQVTNVKLEALSRGVVFPVDPVLANYVKYPKKDKLGCDQVYLINLERRVERRHLMEQSFKELGIEATKFKAIDGRLLNMNDLRQISVTLMPNYEDPYHKRPMKAGEVGCFLSHYSIWKEIAKKHLQTTLILEDDIHFTPHFRRNFRELLEDLENIEWELVYIGRKILLDGKEEFITPRITRPLYSYWTLGYLISEEGARKLIKAEPLSKMLPVDEFLPIMFDQHPNKTWKSYFPIRDLKAYSVTPLLVTPTHYTGQEGYVSDTEDSEVLLEARVRRATQDGEISQTTSAQASHHEL